MNSRRALSLFDHSLVARTEACCTGADAHDLHALLAESDSECIERARSVEQRLRARCCTNELSRLRERAGLEVLGAGVMRRG